MRWPWTLLIMALTGTVLGQEASTRRADVDRAIDRGLDFLAQDAVRWKEDHQCASCHHAALVVWSMSEARQRGRPINAPLFADLTKWLTESGDGKSSLPRPASAPRAFNTKAVYFALGLAAVPHRDETANAGLTRFLKTVQEDQLENGSWAAWPETRPPLFGPSDESMTVLAALTLAMAAETDSTLITARDRAVRWLADTSSDNDPQSVALRLILWRRLARPADECSGLVRQIRQRQNSDGGYSQSAGMASDAWATGQALFGLANAGVPTTDAAIDRAQRFLVTTQREDGSWPMISRPTKPGGSGSSSLVPITGAGSAWAVLGLVGSF